MESMTFKTETVKAIHDKTWIILAELTEFVYDSFGTTAKYCEHWLRYTTENIWAVFLVLSFSFFQTVCGD